MSDAASERDKLYRLLGDLPPRDRPVGATLIAREIRGDYICEHLRLDLNGIEPVPAYFIKPIHATGRLPVVLFNHSHGGIYEIGKRELLEGREYMAAPPYAEELTRGGFAALCIDHWAFGQRRGRTESALFKQMLWEGRVLWGMMVFDSIKAIDYLLTRDDIDAQRIATLGMSMGSTMAWWMAALDERVKVCIDLCCLTDFQSLIDTAQLDAHGVYYYVPGLLKHFTTAQINSLVAPRPHLALAGIRDVLTPVEGLDRIDRELRAVYSDHGSAEKWKLLRFDVAHQETTEMRCKVLQWLNQWIGTDTFPKDGLHRPRLK
jgi:pimeloyl-ACP methyl ester carboxylesterase